MDDIDLNVLLPNDPPFFSAKARNGRLETSGIPIYTRGNKLPPTQPGGSYNGIYVEWQWDGNQLIVRNDRYGMSPLFYSCYDNEIWISPSIHPVLRGNAPKELDDVALSVFLRMGHFIGQDTPFLHIRVLPPNSTLTWVEGRMQIKTASLPICQDVNRSISFDDAVDQFSHLFDQSIARRLPENDDFIVPLSGGRDSRHILFALDSHGKRPKTCVTLKYRPPATNEDARVARLIADEMRIPHVVLEKAASWFDAVLIDVYLTNFCGGSHGWILPLSAWLKGRTHTIYDGLAGSVLSGGFLTDERKMRLYREEKFEELASILLYEGNKEGFNQTVLNRSFYRRTAMPMAVSRLVDELKIHAGASNPMLSFIFWNRTRRMVSQIPYSILSHVPLVHCPYLDHDLYDFITGLDARIFLDNQLHDDAIRRTYPQYAGLPYEDKSKKADYCKADYAYFRYATNKLLKYTLSHGFNYSEFLRKEYLYPKILTDLARRHCHLPWYLISTVYFFEFEEAYKAA
ncbi:asparagine synthetase B family protein [Thiorhodococcus mannitoliphagus]|uniref:asparagine synthase (glutamine-hydrolyzing) n=1 Tax=Thiorhodococcus mannitoliphagus TaxID=329406 RepID=A0A6P1E0Q3_9GAMM|nr:asparagine synthase-related protein [Thiorhodococcus mannitoliphagus]NEX22616.1 asparagine synthetase B family protein [Thiorhodococcus mannitoliphagus]